jgi:hypothetical protein
MLRGFTLYANLDTFSFAIFIHTLCQHSAWTRCPVNNYHVFCSNSDYQFSPLGLGHPLRVFIQGIIQRPLFPAELREHYSSIVFSHDSLCRHRLVDMNATSFRDFIENTKAHFLFLSEEHTISHSHAIYDGKALGVLAAVLPSARPILEHVEYIQLDATFTAVRPYVLCVPLAIIANESFPLGFVMAPSERAKLDEIFADFVQNLGIAHYREKPILSDEGSGLQKYARQHPRHFLCYRHILEGFGSATYLSRIVHQLLFSATREEYCSRAPQAYSLLAELQTKGFVTRSATDKFTRLFGEFPADPSRAGDHFGPQAMWTRNECGASTCSNHIERLHRQLNEAVENCGSLPHRLAQVWKCIEARIQRAGQFRHQQARKKLKEVTSQECEKAVTCPCHCGWSEIYSARFGAEGFPCRHMICPGQLPWRRPVFQAADHIDPEHHLELGTLPFEWLFPDNNQQMDHAVVTSEGEQSESGNGAFLLGLARDCKVLSGRHLDFNRLLMAIIMEWTNIFRDGIDFGDIDLVQLKSRFIVHWWESAKTGEINLDSLPVPV